MKTCSVCGTAKPLDDFHRHPRSSDGKAAACKPCVYARVKAWRQANPERARENDRRAHQRSAVRHRERRRQQARESKERAKQRLLAVKAAMVRGCEECGALIPPEKRVDTRFCSDVCQRRVSHRRHKARSKSSYTEHVDPLIVLERYDGACGICGGDVDPYDFQIDHIIPFALGGLHNYENTQPAHALCNNRKNNRLPEELAA